MDHFRYTNDPSAGAEPLVFVPCGHASPDVLPYPEHYRDQITIDVIHDGEYIPAEYMRDQRGDPVPVDVIQAAYVRERDWGASLVAARLSERLGLGGFNKVTTARCLLDFGRFPGSTQPDAPHLRRFAINHPFSEYLGYRQKKRLLEEHFDRISDGMDAAIRGRLIKIAVHTYDRFNASGTERPHVSLVSRALGYQMDSEMPTGVFDPLYPDILAEFTVDRILRDRISLTLEKAGIPVAHNYPYLLPEGSPEVRHQVWSFFDWLRGIYEDAHPTHATEPGFEAAWAMLMDTNLRSATAGTLRNYLHLYQRPLAGKEARFAEAEDAYRRISEFVHADRGAIVEMYRTSNKRSMSLGLEVRKDLVYEYDRNGLPTVLRPARALVIADVIADAMNIYLNHDRKARGSAPDVMFGRSDRWYAPGGAPPVS